MVSYLESKSYKDYVESQKQSIAPTSDKDDKEELGVSKAPTQLEQVQSAISGGQSIAPTSTTYTSTRKRSSGRRRSRVYTVEEPKQSVSPIAVKAIEQEQKTQQYYKDKAIEVGREQKQSVSPVALRKVTEQIQSRYLEGTSLRPSTKSESLVVQEERLFEKSKVKQFKAGVKEGFILDFEAARKAKDDPRYSGTRGTGFIVGSIGGGYLVSGAGKVVGGTVATLKSISRGVSTGIKVGETALVGGYIFSEGKAIAKAQTREQRLQIITKGGIKFTQFGTGAVKGSERAVQVGFTPKISYGTRYGKFKILSQEAQKIQTGKQKAIGEYKPILETTRKSGFDVDAKTRFKFISREVTGLKGEVVGKKVKISETITDNKLVREISPLKDSKFKVKETFDTGKNIFKREYIKSGKVKKTIKLDKPVDTSSRIVTIDEPVATRQETVFGKKGTVSKTKGQTFSIESTGTRYTGGINIKSLQQSKITKPVREIKSGVEITETGYKSRIISRKRTPQDIQFVTGKAKPKQDILEGAVVAVGETTRILPSRQVQQPRTKTTFIEDVDLRIKFESGVKRPKEIIKESKPKVDDTLLNLQTQYKPKSSSSLVTEQKIETVKVTEQATTDTKNIVKSIQDKLQFKDLVGKTKSDAKVSGSVYYPIAQEKVATIDKPIKISTAPKFVSGSGTVGFVKPSLKERPQYKPSIKVFQPTKVALDTNLVSRSGSRIKPDTKQDIKPKQDVIPRAIVEPKIKTPDTVTSQILRPVNKKQPIIQPPRTTFTPRITKTPIIITEPPRLPKLNLGGGFIGGRRKPKKKTKTKGRYEPTVFSLVTGAKGRKGLKGTGLSIRSISRVKL